MTTRKITLLSVFAFLLIVSILQGISGSISPVKTIKTDSDPDAISITKDGKTIEIVKKNNTWYVGEANYIANKSEVERMIKEIKEIKILDKIAKLGNEDTEEKYGLTANRSSTVRAFKGGKEIQSILVGKTSSTNSQTYCAVSGKKDICLVSGNIASTFGKSETDLRGKTVYAVEESEVTGASVKMGATSWTVSKAGKKDADWQISGVQGVELDQSETTKWIQNVAFMNISSWIDDGTALPANKLTSFTLLTSGDPVTVDIYEVKAGEDSKYYGTCSVTPHKFELTKAQTEKFTKTPESLNVKNKA